MSLLKSPYKRKLRNRADKEHGNENKALQSRGESLKVRNKGKGQLANICKDFIFLFSTNFLSRLF